MNTSCKAAQRRLFILAGLATMAGCGGGGGGGGPAAPQVPATPAMPAAPAGTIERISIDSRALNAAMAVAVHLPAAYNPQARYPVLYLFYGYGGNERSFFDGLGIHRVAERLHAAGAIEPMIIVVPDYANSFGVNTSVQDALYSAGGTIGRYEDYLIDEMLPAVEARFPIEATRAGRRIGGVSMGGFAALHLALRHPALFSRVGAHSAALWDYSAADQFTGQRDWLYPTPALRAARDPLLLAASADLRGLRFHVDVGRRDGLRQQDEALHAALSAHGGVSELRLADGGHDEAYWRAQSENWLLFYGRR